MVFAPVDPESDLLKRVSVRLLHEHKRPEFDRGLEEKHYLHESVLPGQSLRYVAELDGHWVALLAFSAAALHLKAREQWLGWSPRPRARRLGLIVNHSRFLVLLARRVGGGRPAPPLSSGKPCGQPNALCGWSA